MSFSRFLFLSALVAAAVFSRLLPHPPNFTALGAAAVFAGATLDRRHAFWVPLVAMALSDALIGWHSLAWVVYPCLALSAWMGSILNPRSSVSSFAGLGAASAFVFYLVTNFAVWAFQGMYPHTLDGLGLCYLSALPFLGNMVMADIVFAVVLVGIARLGEKMHPALRAPSAVPFQSH